MKKFIIALIFCLVSVMSYGQYINQDYSKENKMLLQDFPEYKDAKSKIISGSILMASGIAAEAIGCIMVINSPETMTIRLSDDTGSLDWDSGIISPMRVIGYSLVIGGLVTGIIGTVKVIKGTVKLKDAKITYAIQNGASLVVNF